MISFPSALSNGVLLAAAVIMVITTCMCDSSWGIWKDFAMLSTILGGVVDDRQHSNGYRQAVLYKRGLNFMIMGLTKLVCCKCDVYSREMEELTKEEESVMLSEGQSTR